METKSCRNRGSISFSITWDPNKKSCLDCKSYVKTTTECFVKSDSYCKKYDFLVPGNLNDKAVGCSQFTEKAKK